MELCWSTVDKELVHTAALSHLYETFLVLPFRESIIRSKICVQTGCRARGRGFSPSTTSCRGQHWGEEQVWRHSSSLQGGKADTKNMPTVLEGWKSLLKGPNAVSPLRYMAKLPSVATGAARRMERLQELLNLQQLPCSIGSYLTD